MDNKEELPESTSWFISVTMYFIATFLFSFIIHGAISHHLFGQAIMASESRQSIEIKKLTKRLNDNEIVLNSALEKLELPKLTTQGQEAYVSPSPNQK